MKILDSLEKFYTKKSMELKLLEDEENKCLDIIDDLTTQKLNLTDAREVINAVGLLAKDKTTDLIEALVTQALQSIYGSNFSFEVEHKIVRNQTETYFWVVEDGHKYSLRDEMLGCGVLDVVSFVLRVVLWSISSQSF